MLHPKINSRLELPLISPEHTEEFFNLVDSNREYLRRWHPWTDNVRSPDDADKMISTWERQNANNRGFCAVILSDGQLCGTICHLNVDWPNGWTALSYWLDEAHQGKGIMTACCRAMIAHSFETWNLNRVTIECAAQNHRSRAIPERLGFKLEGVVRGIERLPDGSADHAIYGLLKVDCPPLT